MKTSSASTSQPRPLVLIGAGEHARVVVDIARSQPERYRLRGFVDREPSGDAEARLGVPYLGTDDEGLLLAARTDAWMVLAIGCLGPSPMRRRLADAYTAAGARWATLVHARAWVSPAASVSEGAVVAAGAVVNSGARLGAHSLVNTGAIIEHDVLLGDHAVAGPGAVVGGGAVIGPDAFLGLGSRVRDHVRIGRGAQLGMGAVLVNDAPAGAVLLGVPARARTGAAAADHTET